MRSPVWGGADYPVTQPFLPGDATHPAVHCGIDIGCPSGTIIKAARAGRVERVQQGMVGVLVRGTALRDFYLHGYSLVTVGQVVEVGQPLIHSDTVAVDPRYPPTGPHLHFEVQDGYSLPGAPPGAPERPLDPVPVLTGLSGAASHTIGDDMTPEEHTWTFTAADNSNKILALLNAVNATTLGRMEDEIKAIPGGDNAAVLAALAGLKASQDAMAADIATIQRRIEKDLAP